MSVVFLEKLFNSFLFQNGVSAEPRLTFIQAVYRHTWLKLAPESLVLIHFLTIT